MQPFRSTTIKFLHGSLLLILLFPALGFGFKCHYCKSATSNLDVSPCAEGEETELRECFIPDPLNKPDDGFNCQYKESAKRKRTHLGCKHTGSIILDPQYNRDVDGNSDFYCRRDGCNSKPDELKCLICGMAIGIDHECVNREEPREALCMLGYNMCFTAVSSLSSRVLKGCLKKSEHLPSENSTATEPFCTRHGQCFCFTSLCNTYSSEKKIKQQQGLEEQHKTQVNTLRSTSLSPAILFSLKLYTLSTLFVILY